MYELEHLSFHREHERDLLNEASWHRWAQSGWSRRRAKLFHNLRRSVIRILLRMTNRISAYLEARTSGCWDEAAPCG